MTKFKINLNNIKGKVDGRAINTNKEHYQRLLNDKFKYHNQTFIPEDLEESPPYSFLIGTPRKPTDQNYKPGTYWHWHPEWYDVIEE